MADLPRDVATQSRDHLLGRIAGLMEAQAMASRRPTAFAFSVRQEIEELLAPLRSALVDGHHL